MHRDIVHKISLLPRCTPKNLPQPIRLDVVLVADLSKHRRDGLPRPRLVRRRGVHVRAVGQGPVRGRVVGVGAVVAVHGHGTVALERVEGVERPVDGDLGVVDAQPVAVRVRVGEEPRLQDRVGRGLDAGDQVRRREGDLLHLGKIVVRVAVQRQLAHGPQRHLGLRPHLGQVEDVPPEALGLRGRERLDGDGPAGGLAALDGLEEVLRVPVRVLGGHAPGLLVGEGLAALVRLEVDLHVHERPVGLGELHGVARVAVHVPVRVRRAPVRKQVHHLVDALLVRAQVVPEHGRVLEVGLRVALLRVDEDGEVDRVPQEEDGRVVEYPVIIALLCVELDGEAYATSQSRLFLRKGGKERGQEIVLPLGSRAESGEPFSPPTVENRHTRGVFLPTPVSISTEQTSEMSCVTSNYI